MVNYESNLYFRERTVDKRELSNFVGRKNGTVTDSNRYDHGNCNVIENV